MLFQSTAAIATEIITTTKAATGIRATMSLKATTKMIRETPARKVEIHVRALEALILIMVWSNIAQPPMNPVIMFAASSPMIRGSCWIGCR